MKKFVLGVLLAVVIVTGYSYYRDYKIAEAITDGFRQGVTKGAGEIGRDLLKGTAR